MNTPSITETATARNRPRQYFVARVYGPALACPVCQQTAHYSGGARRVTCPTCGLTLTLTHQENNDLTDLVCGIPAPGLTVAGLLSAIYAKVGA